MSRVKGSGSRLLTPHLSLPYLTPLGPLQAWVDRCLSDVAPCKTPLSGPRPGPAAVIRQALCFLHRTMLIF